MGPEKRIFRRYRVSSPIRVLKKGESFMGRAFNYSLEGIGAEIEDHPPLRKGEDVSYLLAGQEADSPGRVVRAEQTESGLKLGILRTGALSGSVGYFDLADVFLGLQRSGKTGTFHISDGDVRREIFIEDGDMIYAASNQESDSLGRLLISAGKLTEQQYARALEAKEMTGRRLGAVLVELHYIDPNTLVWAVRRFAEGIILNVFRMRRGWFTFTEGPVSTDEVIKLRLSTANLIYKGIMGIADPKRLMPFLPPLGSALHLSSDPLDLFQDLALSEADREVLGLIDGRRSIGDVLKASKLPDVRALKLIFVLLSTRIIEAGEKGAGAEAPPVEGLFKQVKEDDQKIIERINAFYNNLSGTGPLGILGVGSSATRSEIKRAFYARAKEFHPDRHYHLPTEMKDKLHAIFAAITNAYSALIDSTGGQSKSSPPPTASVDPAELALRKFEAGKAALREADYAKAARHFAEAVYLDSSNHSYNFYLGAALMRTGKHAEAERSLRKALQSEPFNAQYLAEIGHAYLALGFGLRARGNFEKALKIDPMNRRAADGMKAFEGEKDDAKGGFRP